MIVFRYLFLETLKSQLAVFFILLTIFTSQTLIRVLGDAMEGKLPTDLVAWMLLLNTPALAGLILPLSLFIGIFLAHGRLHADNEMSVLRACGVSEWYVTRITLALAVVVAFVTALNTVWLGPAAYEKRAEIREKIKADIGLATLIPGRFQQSSNNKAVIFVHDTKQSGAELNKVFVAQLPRPEDENQRFNVVYAEKGFVEENDDGSQKLYLDNGYRYEGEKNQRDYEITEFGQYEFLIKEREFTEARRKLFTVPMADLFERDDLHAIAEWQWRIALPLSVPIIAMIAVPLARVKPRKGKYAKLVPAFLIYLIYYLMLMSGRSAIEEGKIPPIIGLWWIHAKALLYGAWLFLGERTTGRKIKSRLRRRSA